MNATIAYSLLGVVVLLILACLWWFRRDYRRRNRPMLRRGPEPVHVVPLPYPTAPRPTIVCAWCQPPRVIRPGDAGGLLSHGICEACAARCGAELREQVAEAGA